MGSQREKVGGGMGDWPEEKVWVLRTGSHQNRQQLSCHNSRSCVGCLQESCGVTEEASRAKS